MQSESTNVPTARTWNAFQGKGEHLGAQGGERTVHDPEQHGASTFRFNPSSSTSERKAGGGKEDVRGSAMGASEQQQGAQEIVERSAGGLNDTWSGTSSVEGFVNLPARVQGEGIHEEQQLQPSEEGIQAQGEVVREEIASGQDLEEKQRLQHKYYEEREIREAAEEHRKEGFEPLPEQLEEDLAKQGIHEPNKETQWIHVPTEQHAVHSKHPAHLKQFKQGRGGEGSEIEEGEEMVHFEGDKSKHELLLEQILEPEEQVRQQQQLGGPKGEFREDVGQAAIGADTTQLLPSEEQMFKLQAQELPQGEGAPKHHLPRHKLKRRDRGDIGDVGDAGDVGEGDELWREGGVGREEREGQLGEISHFGEESRDKDYEEGMEAIRAGKEGRIGGKGGAHRQGGVTREKGEKDRQEIGGAPDVEEKVESGEIAGRDRLRPEEIAGGNEQKEEGEQEEHIEQGQQREMKVGKEQPQYPQPESAPGSEAQEEWDMEKYPQQHQTLWKAKKGVSKGQEGGEGEQIGQQEGAGEESKSGEEIQQQWQDAAQQVIEQSKTGDIGQQEQGEEHLEGGEQQKHHRRKHQGKREEKSIEAGDFAKGKREEKSIEAGDFAKDTQQHEGGENIGEQQPLLQRDQPHYGAEGHQVSEKKGHPPRPRKQKENIQTTSWEKDESQPSLPEHLPTKEVRTKPHVPSEEGLLQPREDLGTMPHEQGRDKSLSDVEPREDLRQEEVMGQHRKHFKDREFKEWKEEGEGALQRHLDQQPEQWEKRDIAAEQQGEGVEQALGVSTEDFPDKGGDKDVEEGKNQGMDESTMIMRNQWTANEIAPEQAADGEIGEWQEVHTRRKSISLHQEEGAGIAGGLTAGAEGTGSVEEGSGWSEWKDKEKSE